MLVGLSAAVVSFVGLGIGFYSAYIDRAYARASAWPSVVMGRSMAGEKFNYNASNQGTGPALIRSVRVGVGNEAVQTWHELIEALDIKHHLNSFSPSLGPW